VEAGIRLVASIEAAVKRGASGIISFEIAGGLVPDLVAGDWVVGSSVVTDHGHFPTGQVWARTLAPARTALDARIAEQALRRGRRSLGLELGFPYFGLVVLDALAAAEAN
jgi:hypothetical protein